MRNNFIVNTDSLYMEINKDYLSLSINLVAVEKASKTLPSQSLLREKNFSRGSNFSWELLRDLTKRASSRLSLWGDMPEEYVDYNKMITNSDVLYEVVVIWSYMDSGYMKDCRVSSHPMELLDAQKEKKNIVTQINTKGPIMSAVEKFLEDPNTLVIGLLGDDCEREIARVIKKNLDKIKEV